MSGVSDTINLNDLPGTEISFKTIIEQLRNTIPADAIGEFAYLHTENLHKRITGATVEAGAYSFPVILLPATTEKPAGTFYLGYNGLQSDNVVLKLG